MTCLQSAVGLAFGLVLVFNQSLVPHTHQLVFEPLVTCRVASQGRNEIHGTVFSESHRPVVDVYVELMDAFYSPIRHTKSDGAGHFSFRGLIDGSYLVKVLPFGTDYKEQTQEVTLTSVSSTAGSGSDTQRVDIQLKLNDRPGIGPFGDAPGVVFAQEVPPAAKKLYEEGLSYLREKKEKQGLESLKNSIEAFPQYYLALNRLGVEYALRGTKNPAYLQAGFEVLTRAVEINPNGFSSVFGLGWTQYHLGLNAEAIETLKHATSLYGRAPDAYLWLGKALKRAAALDQAEVALKRANELSRGKSAEVHWQLAEVYNGQQRFKESADQLELYLKTVPRGVEAEKIKTLIKQLRDKALAQR